MASSVRCIISLALGSWGDSVASVGLGTGGATAAAGRIWVNISCVRASSRSTFWLATTSSVFALSRGSAGKGVLARRLASVLPPPSRWAWARISALVGFVADLAFTSATSRGRALRSKCGSSKGVKRIARMTAWIRIDWPSRNPPLV